MKPVFLIVAALLLVGMANLPIGYYTFLRIAVTVVCVLGIIGEYSSKIDFWIIALGLTAILFNPIIPIYFRDKTIWIIFDAICGTMFIIKAFTLKSNK
jgi:hypothetical protein